MAISQFLSRKRWTIETISLLLITLVSMLSNQTIANGNPISIVDSLGAATPATQFSIFGSGGVSILPTQFVGPQFTLAEPTTITEIGGFANSSIVQGGTVVNAAPFIVQIHLSTGGIPDPMVLTSLTLSHQNNNPLLLAYESVTTSLPLGPGTYFAMFAPQGSDEGFLLGSATIPFDYSAEFITMGCIGASCGGGVFAQSAATRILGEPVPEPSSLVLLGSGLLGLAGAVKRKFFSQD